MPFFERTVHVPAAGGYTFTQLTSNKGTFAVDDLPPVSTPKPRKQVCGMPENAVQAPRISAALVAGDHRIRWCARLDRRMPLDQRTAAEDEPVLLWEGPGLERQVVPQSAFGPGTAVPSLQ